MKVGENSWMQFQIDHFGWKDIAQFLGVDRSMVWFDQLECAGCKWLAYAQIDGVLALCGDGVWHAVGNILAGLQLYIVETRHCARRILACTASGHHSLGTDKIDEIMDMNDIATGKDPIA